MRGWGRRLLPAPCFLGSQGKEGSPPWLPSDAFPLASHQELRKLKELMSATEKIRREKWIDEKTKKIKEITVKGTRPQHKPFPYQPVCAEPTPAASPPAARGPGGTRAGPKSAPFTPLRLC